MKLQARILLLLTLFFVAIAVLLSVQRNFDIQRSNQVLKSELRQRKSLFDTNLASEGQTFQTFSEDYSFWDDMVSFVKTDDLNFAHVNLDSGLETFGADGDWVYTPTGSLLYSSKVDPSLALATPSLPPNFFQKLTSDKFEHFYLQTTHGTLEIRAATIVPGDDPDHHSAPAGFWVIGRYLNGAFLKRLDTSSQSTVQFKAPTAGTTDLIGSNSVSFSVPLKDAGGNTVQLLRSTSKISLISDLNALYTRELVLLGAVSASILVLVSTAIWWSVIRPIRLIAQSIRTQQPQMIAKISTTNSQFGDLARTVRQFFEQKLVIEEDQFKKTELERLNKEKSAFLAVAAHELKSPILIIKLLSEDLPRALSNTPVDPSVQKQLAIITHQVVKMTTFINDLRLTSEGKEQTVFTKTTFDFDEFLRKEVTEMGYIINQELELSGETRRQVNADPDRLSQVVSNLIRNAAKYSPGTPKIVIRSSVSNDTVVVELQDFGVGISPEDAAHIFERFYRAPSVTETFQGMGLGLSICQSIMDHMGGKIWVESRLGQGSHFYISLPAVALTSER